MSKLVHGKVRYIELDFNNQNDEFEIHRGPNNLSKNVLEIKTVERIYTLYTDHTDITNKFYLYLNKMIELRDRILKLKKEKY